jgi:hypothetical protein
LFFNLYSLKDASKKTEIIPNRHRGYFFYYFISQTQVSFKACFDAIKSEMENAKREYESNLLILAINSGNKKEV